MTTLFGKTSLEQLRDLDYKTESHTFSKGVIAAYYNSINYETLVEPYFIAVNRKKDTVCFLLQSERIIFEKIGKNDTVYSQVKTELCKKKTKEVIYNLDETFTNPSKQVRRSIKLTERKEILQSETVGVIDELYNEWQSHKMNDGKTYRISFTPKRYLRAFQLKEKGFNIYDTMYYVNGTPYGALCYEVQGDIAFELAFISRFWRKDLKICNDLNELILIHSFYELWKKGIKRVNVGPVAGIKGLRVFKNKLPHKYVEIYSN